MLSKVNFLSYLVVAVIGFVDTMYEVVEGVDTAVTVEIELQSGILGQEVEARVFTVDGSAQGKRLLHKRKLLIYCTAPGDYIQVSQCVIFSQTATSFNVTVMITDDVIFENREQFSFRIEIISAEISIFPGETTVTINDTDGEKCSCLCPRNF